MTNLEWLHSLEPKELSEWFAAEHVDTRAERTCKNLLPPDWGTFECSECGNQFEVTPVYITAGGTPNDEPDPACVSFCPGCGAKVTSVEVE